MGLELPQSTSSGSHNPPHLPDISGQLSHDIAHLQLTKETLQQEVEMLQTQVRSLREAVQQTDSHTGSAAFPPDAKPIPLEFPAAPLPVRDSPKAKSLVAKLQIGLWLVLLSTISLSVHNIIVRIILGKPSNLFGLVSLGGFIQPSLGNSLLILWVRMLIVVPMMAAIAGSLYPPVWTEIRNFVLSRDRRLLLNIVGSGGFLFLSQVLIYIAIGQIGPSAAVTILFMYPLVTVPLAWWLFGDQPSRLRVGVMVLILLGVVFTAIPSLSKTAVSGGGVFAAVLAGVSFAFYLVLMQLGFKRLHPVPVSLVQFITILFLSSLSLSLSPIDLGVSVLAENRFGLAIGGFVLGALTLLGYLTNNFGVRYMGAARSSIIASSGPVLTAVLAAIVLQSQLAQIQVVGILLVTLGVTGLSFERMKKMAHATKAAK
ncbi:DMT family transporter [Myxacorys almedinensis]|uniref:EamA family transporter n=1 Tax=Myxacorys almedinensis A TaxID=2690445 RepID=A0A8J7ZA14_9CYAN|nr:DMT family transporter [Myxacorys almedinensis]NDJ19138.1 EamA family transporter [Myxacorys almedinensis A]